MTTATHSTSQDQIQRANERKTRALQALAYAHKALLNAQNHVTDIEGNGSAAIYDSIADVYQQVATLQQQLRRLQPTGLFE